MIKEKEFKLKQQKEWEKMLALQDFNFTMNRLEEKILEVEEKIKVKLLE